MSSRSQRKKKPRPTSFSADSEKEDYVPRKSRQVNKPKYVLEAERGDTPSSTRSQLSTPDSSRPSSPAVSVSRSNRKARSTKKSTKSTPSKSKKGGSKSGTATPISRTSRSSSVSSTAKKSRSSKKTVPKLKIKTKLGRGYNPNLVNYKDSEYHYGSDFDDEDHKEVESEQSSESTESEMEEDSDDMKPESDVELEPVSIEDRDSFTPVPYWLQDYAEIPSLTLPKSSDDLCIDKEFVFQAVAIYEVLRQFFYTIRLSPFRLEDFIMALSSEDQSNLLSEVHIALLKSLLREEDREQVQFGPLDQKDSMNVFLQFIDPITWPENLRFYLSADPATNQEVLQILNSTEYPFTSVGNRISMLSFLTNQLLSTSAVREDLINEGQLPLEDHCRVCHKLGDMVVCELCNGPFHGTCLEPPLFEIPEEDFICPVCHLHQVEGVADCVTTDRGANRHDSLGIDRSGNKYWFACRRLWIEGRDGDISYFSTKFQFKEVLEALDSVTYERELCEAIEGIREDLESQMEVTEKLTNEQKSGFKRSYLEMENASLEKLQMERNDLREKEEEEQRRAQEDVDRQIREEGEERRKIDEEKAKKEREEEEEKKRITRDEGLEKREEMRGDSFQDDFPDDILDEDVEPMEEVTTTVTTTTTQVITTTSQITSTTARAGSSLPTSADFQDMLDLEEEINPQQLREERRQAEAERGIRQLEREERAIEKETQFAKLVTSAATTTSPIIKRSIVPPGVYFKLGQEGGYKQYTNQYTIQQSSLSKAQIKQEQEQRTRLSHKFSLTEVCGFKWNGSTHGSRAHIVTTLRQTILQLENNIPTSFMHANWALLRKPWINAVTTCSNPRDFSRAMTVLTCCVKLVVMLPVWNDALGHTSVKKVGFQARDDKKKMEKRERKEREEEEEKMKPWMAWVKYTLPVKSLTVVRQKGEEYRAHGRNGWLWLSTTRVWKPADSRQAGLSVGPHRLAVKYTDLKNNTSKVVLMDPKAFAFLIKTQKERDDKALARMVSGEEEEVEDPSEIVVKTDEDKRRANLTKILDMSRIDEQEANQDDLGGPDGVVDVSKGVVNPTRLIFPRVSKKSSKLDDLLARRVQLRTLEERRIELQSKVQPGTGTEGESDTKTSVTSDIVAAVKEDIAIEAWINLTKKKLLNCVKSVRDAISQDSSAMQSYTCCSPLCQSEGPANCYSPTCRAKPRSLVTATQIYKEVVKEAKMYEVTLPQMEEGTKFENVKEATQGLTQLVKMLLEKAKEVAETNTMETVETVTTSLTTTTSTTTTVVNGMVKSKVESTVSDNSSASVKTEDGSVVDAKGSFESKSVKTESSETEQGLKRTYTVEDTSGALYLKRIQSVAEAKKTNRIVKYPVAPHFIGKSRSKRNILILGKHDIRKMARNFGQTTAEGFNYNAKANQQTWNYPCPRPTFRTTWLYRTAGMNSIHAVALQLRSIWICIRWDDMNTKQGANTDGKHQQTTESEIITTEILKHRNVGLFLERTQYFQRRISIPLDVPKKQVDYSPIRSGLRKRKRAESPVHAEPRVEESWIDEDNLELWEIKAYRDKIERERTAAITRRQGGREIKAPDRLDPSEEVKVRKKVPADDIKAKMEENLRQQREAFKAGQSIDAKPSLSGLGGIRKSGDGIKVLGGKPIIGGLTMAQRTVNANNMPFAKKIFMSKDGKVIGHQIANVGQSPQNKVAPPGKVAIPPTPAVASPGQSNQQKVQIVKSADGKIQVRGLLHGQQLVQMPDGKLQIFSHSPGANAGKIATPGKIIQAGALPGQVINKPVMQLPQQQLLPKPSLTPQQPLAQPQKTYAIQRTPTQAIQPKPVPTTTQMLNTSPPQLVVNKPGHMVPPTPTIQPNPTPSLPPTPSQLVGAAGAASPNKNMVVGIQSLGQNTVTIKDGQLMVQGPDHAAATAIARQLSSGAARLASLGGKQVLLSTTPAAGTNPQQFNQPTPEPSLAPSTITAPDSTVSSPPPQLPPALHSPEPPPPPREPTPPPTPLTVTAQLVQTPQGPRIILQGLQGIQLEQHQLMTIQQTVKQQLLKQQALARQQGRVPPTKVSVPLPANIQPIRTTESVQQPQQQQQSQIPQLPQVPDQQIQQQQPQQVRQQQQQPVIKPPQQQQQVPEPSIALPSFSQQQQQPLASPSFQQQQQQSMSSPSLQQQQTAQQPQLSPQQPQLRTSDGQLLPASLLKQGQIMMRNGQKVLVLPPAVLQQHQKDQQKSPLAQQQQEKPQPQKSLLLSSLTSPRKEGMMSPGGSMMSPGGGHGGMMSPGGGGMMSPPKMDPMLASPTENMIPGGDATPDKFELTTDYIQETIKNALKDTDNLTPEMEEKLLSQLDGGTGGAGLPSASKGRFMVAKGKNNRAKPVKPIDPATGEPMDDEWQPLSWKTKMNATKKRTDGEVEVDTSTSSDSNNCFEGPDMPSVSAPALPSTPLHAPTPPRPIHAQVSPSSSRIVQRGARLVKKGGVTPGDEKRRTAIQNKLASLLFKQKETLKKDIAKKRANLEKQLKLDIDKNVDLIKTNLKARAEMLKNSSRKRSSTDARAIPQVGGGVGGGPTHPRPVDSSPPPAKRKKTPHPKTVSNADDDQVSQSLKKDKVYCICKTKYDATKFYVGCDLCSSWFHGSCIGITEKQSRGMTEYVCDECSTAKETEQIYCLCKQPYDEAQFYIGCENCHGWFHGRCVGILQAEADEIDEYLCPRCDPKSKLNYANLKQLSERDYDLIKKTLKQIQLNKNSSPFKEAVDPNEHPKYYETVREPMDLQTVELRVTQVQYEKLAEFIGDITRIFENCRYWNAQGSAIAIAAENLEDFFSKKITLVREKVLSNK